MAINDTPPSDGNTSQWDKLKAMRQKRDGEQQGRDPATGKFVAPEKVIEEQKRLEAGEPVGGKVVGLDTPPETSDDDDDDDDDETPPVDPPAATPPADTPPADAPPADKPPVAAAPPGTEAVEIDGKTVYVDPSLAAAFRNNQARETASKDAATHDKLVDDVATRVVERLPAAAPPAAPATTQITGPKSPAEIVADKALADALAAQPAQRPSSSLQLSNPDEYDRQMEAHIADTARIASQRALAEKEQRDAVAGREAAARTDAQREAQAREFLSQRFYGEYKVLDTPANRRLVDPMLEQRWSAIKERLRTNPPKTPQEGEALRVREFEAIAAEATRAIVDIRGPGANAPAAPPAPPPTLNTSTRATRAAAPPKPPVEKPREKYPAGSVSAILANHQKGKRDGAAA